MKRSRQTAAADVFPMPGASSLLATFSQVMMVATLAAADVSCILETARAWMGKFGGLFGSMAGSSNDTAGHDWAGIG